MLKELITASRSFRRFHEDYAIARAKLVDLVELAQLGPSAANLQPLKYYLSFDVATNERIFPHLAWAGYLTDWDGPEQGERPSGYIIILGDQQIAKNFHCDHGIAAQNILLGATEMGLGGCIIASIQKDKLADELDLPDPFDILLVIALGKPNETVILETLGDDGDIKYWRDDQGTHHVPKRKLDDILLP